MRDRMYFPIDEKMAKLSHDMMSFSDYQEGSLTAEYKGHCDKAYDLADEAAEKYPEDAEKAYGLAERYAKKMADNLNKRSRIGTMCPSVMVSGGSNFPVRKKEKQNAATDRNYQEWNEIQKLLDQIRKIGSGKGIIKSGDAEAVDKLEKKLASLKKMQEKMKIANKAIRLKNTEKGDAALREMGYSDEQIQELRKPDFCGRVGYPSYMLQNNNANIHRIEGRLKNLKATKERGTFEQENDLFKVVENTEIMRLQLIFDGKPTLEVRNILKKNGFRWSYKNSAWQRQITSKARCALERVKEELGVQDDKEM